MPYEAGHHQLEMTFLTASRAGQLLDEGFGLRRTHSVIQPNGLVNPKLCFGRGQSDFWNQDLTYLENSDLSHRIVTKSGSVPGGACSWSSIGDLLIVAPGRGCLLIGGFGFETSFQSSDCRRRVRCRSVLRPFLPDRSPYWLQTSRLARIECPGSCSAS